MPEKVLFVDDEANVLSALQRQFRKQFKVTTALGGANGLKMIEEEGPFAVIVSDMQMPEMSGLQFLQAAQEKAPDTVRLMLTGNADQKTAVDAVNHGNVFSFLTKPCPPDVMASTMDSAVAQHHLITAEKELLEGTLNGSIKLLMDMLSMVAPDAFGRTMAVREAAEKVANAMQLENTWDLDMAAMLFNLASVTLPPETLAKTCSGEALSDEEQKMVERMPETCKSLITNIPRLERVADIVLYQQKKFNGSGFPEGGPSGEEIPVESRILKVLCDLENLKAQETSLAEAFKTMAANEGSYDPLIFKTTIGVLGSNDGDAVTDTPVESSLRGLRDGYVLAANIETVEGKLLIKAGNKITAPVLERLLNYDRVNKVKEPIMVFKGELA